MPKHQFMLGQSRMSKVTATDEFGPTSTEFRYPDRDGTWSEEVERQLRLDGFLLDWQPSVSLHWDVTAAPATEEATGQATMYAEISADEILSAAAFIRRERAKGQTINSYAFQTGRLNRRDFNDGIRAMKRARNAVYGADE